MKKLLFIIALAAISSCAEKNNSVENEKLQSELSKYETTKATELSTKAFAHGYIKAVNSSDWKSEVLEYLNPSPARDIFFKEHAAFRAAFQNYNATIKHVTIDGNKAIIWINITAIYAEPFSLDKSAYGDEMYTGIEAKNQVLSWDETWYFNVDDGKFGNEWDFLKDNHTILASLK